MSSPWKGVDGNQYSFSPLGKPSARLGRVRRTGGLVGRLLVALGLLFFGFALTGFPVLLLTLVSWLVFFAVLL